MPRRFGAQNIKNGYAAMGDSRKRPRYKGGTSKSVAEAIAAARHQASKEARLKASSKKK